jgi:hypothetical protein
MPITLRIKKSCSENVRLLGQVGGNSNKPKTVTGARDAEVAIQPATGESPRLIPQNAQSRTQLQSWNRVFSSLMMAQCPHQ